MAASQNRSMLLVRMGIDNNVVALSHCRVVASFASPQFASATDANEFQYCCQPGKKDVTVRNWQIL
jgi:hypothetical protein